MTIYTKICGRCKISKSISEFSKNKITKDGFRNQCKACDKEYRENNREKIKEWRENNVEKKKEINKKWRKNNPEKIKEYNKNNKERIYKKQKEYIDNKRKTDPLYALTRRIRSLVCNSFTRNGFSKNLRAQEILGCSFEEFLIHIESQFTEGMTWDNRDRWHLDHKEPVSWGDTEERIVELNHHRNFQPMWAEDNWSKGNRRRD